MDVGLRGALVRRPFGPFLLFLPFGPFLLFGHFGPFGPFGSLGLQDAPAILDDRNELEA